MPIILIAVITSINIFAFGDSFFTALGLAVAYVFFLFTLIPLALATLIAVFEKLGTKPVAK